MTTKDIDPVGLTVAKKNKKQLEKKMQQLAEHKIEAVAALNIDIIRRIKLKSQIFDYYQNVLDELAQDNPIDKIKLDQVNSIMREIK